MRSESPEAELATPPATGRSIGIPVVCSVLLHVVVLTLFARAQFAPPAQGRIPDERPHLSIALVMRPPPRSPERQTQQSAVVPEQELEEELVATARTVGETVATRFPDTDPEAEPVETGESGPALPVWTPATIRAAVGAHVSKQHKARIATWVSDCIVVQNEHGTRDCERQLQASDDTSPSARAGRAAAAGTFAGLTRRTRYALLTEGFEMGNTVLKDLMTAPGVLGQLAADRYFLNREYVFYLNGNPSPYGAANQFNCKGPCVYEYTGFVVVRPEAKAEENAFRVVPTVFASPLKPRVNP